LATNHRPNARSLPGGSKKGFADRKHLLTFFIFMV
jgi:hypothetical protein